MTFRATLRTGEHLQFNSLQAMFDHLKTLGEVPALLMMRKT